MEAIAKWDVQPKIGRERWMKKEKNVSQCKRLSGCFFLLLTVMAKLGSNRSKKTGENHNNNKEKSPKSYACSSDATADNGRLKEEGKKNKAVTISQNMAQHQRFKQICNTQFVGCLHIIIFLLLNFPFIFPWLHGSWLRHCYSFEILYYYYYFFFIDFESTYWDEWLLICPLVFYVFF